jgi:hypothetical protein
MIYALFCGSREWSGWEEVELIKERLRTLPLDSVIIHGAARGADSIAAFEADMMGFEDIRTYPADWQNYGKAAGPIRNRQMLDILLEARGAGVEVKIFAFHEDPDFGIGTRDMINIAEAAGFTVEKCLRSHG